MPPPPPDYTWSYGWALLVVAYVGFAVSMYALVVSKWMPLTGNKVCEDQRRACMAHVVLTPARGARVPRP